MPESKRPLKVFLCHARADRDRVHALYTRLTKDGVDAWLDKEKLLPGQDWELEIRKAVRESDVVLVCHSRQFNQKGFRQKEVNIALEEADLLPKGEIFIIPLRLEECEVLDDLKKWHWVDLFEKDGYEMLMRALHARADKIGATLQSKRIRFPKIHVTSSKSIVQTKHQELELNEQSKPDSGNPTSFSEESPLPSSERNYKSIIAIISMLGVVAVLITIFILDSISGDEGKILSSYPTTTIETLSVSQNTVTPSKTHIPSPTSTIALIVTSSVESTLTPTPTLIPTPITASIVIMTDDPRQQNCRVKPNTDDDVVEKIAPGTNLLAYGRNEKGDWLLVKLANKKSFCWINVSGVKYQSTEINQLPLGILYVKDVEMALIPAGEFTMGKNANDAFTECLKYGSSCKLDWFTDANTESQISLGAFYIDRYEVTNLNYRECVDDGKCDHPKELSLNDIIKDYYTNAKYNDYPVVYVDWEMANSYCRWRGTRLPTESEWEKAARGIDKRIFPWGNTISCDYANYRERNGHYCYGLTTAVGSIKGSISPYGIYDMAGNVWEWVSSLYRDYPYNPDDGREDLTIIGNRVMRGGSWAYFDYNAFATNRNTNSSTSNFNNVGFRCARDVNP